MFKISNARLVSKTESNVTVEFDVSSPTAHAEKATLFVNGVPTETVAVQAGDALRAAKATFSAVNASNFDFSAEYALGITGVRATARVSLTALADDPDFIAVFENKDTLSCEFGATVGNGRTTFRVWAPFASSVGVKLYDGNASRTEALGKRVRDGVWGGVWEREFPADLDGTYYNFVVTNGDAETEAVDPYAKACDANGLRGMVINLDRTDPPGWENDKYLCETDSVAADIPIVWEIHVADFSSSPDSGMRFKGKYLAFTEENTCVPGKPELKTGIAYLKDLGVTYVQLNPVYDFATVDEGDLGKADNTKDNFNWGYDPQNFNIPEGSYSTDPSKGEVRINEFKQMVAALHRAGIGVVMDVVYNHTYTVGGQALHDTVPGYYHRTHADGTLTDGSGCGNETATERAMMRKYIVDSVVYWATEYHIDGFRFDLMGLYDAETIKAVRTALDKACRAGARLLTYGEPWSADGIYIPPSFTRRVKAAGENKNMLIKNCSLSMLPARVAVFNDDARDGIRGNNDPGPGWIHGSADKTGTVAAMLNGTAKNLGVASHNVVYASAHDNYTLWDQAIGVPAGRETPLFYENATEYAVKRCKLASAAYLSSPGIAFMLAGEEMGRTKYGNHNSYNSPVKLNRIVWSRQAEFGELLAHYKALVKARRNAPELFSYSHATKETHGGNFSAVGLTVKGTRGGLSLWLDADGGSGCVEIDGKTVTEF